MKITNKNSDIEIIVIQSLSQIHKIENDWIDLINLSRSKNIYSDPIFFKNMFKFRASSALPHVVLFYFKNKVCGIIIGWIDKKIIPLRIGYFRFHSPQLTSMDIEIGGIITDGEEHTNIELTQYLSQLLHSRNIDLLKINHILNSHPILDFLLEKKSFITKPIISESINWIAKIRDEGTGVKIQNNSSKTLNGIRRRERKLLAYFDNELDVIDYSDRTDLELFIDRADYISKKSYQFALNVGIKNTTFWHKYIKSLSENKYLGAYLLMNHNKPISYIFGFKYKNIFYLYATSYDNELNKYSPGEYLRNKVTDILISEGINRIDYGYGEADYKRLYGTDAIPESTLHIYGLSLKSKYSKYLEKISISTHGSLLKILNNIGMINSIKKIIRKFLIKKTS